MMTRKYQLLVISLLILTAFSPAFFAGFSSIDDVSMRQANDATRWWHISDMLMPAVGGGLYYRPFIGISFSIDNQLLGFDPGIMHLENVGLHLINAVLIFYIVWTVLPIKERTGSILPFGASLLFALHPVNAESVNWISGRTDILAGTFLFTSLLFLLKFKDGYRKRFLILSILCYLGSGLTKETALAFLPGALMVLTSRESSGFGYAEANRVSDATRRKLSIVIACGFIIAAFLLFGLRSTAFTSNASRIGLTIRVIVDDWMGSMFMILRTYTFYMKKLIFPFPLNFAIVEIDPLYELAAVPCVLLSIYLTTRRTLLAALFASGILMITPSFLLAFGQIAWTPYAERYVYLASGFFVISFAMALSQVIPRRFMAWVSAGFIILSVILFASMIQRSMIWQNELRLMEDTIGKSPDFRPLRAVYAMELARQGSYAQAKEQVDTAREIFDLAYDPRYDFISAYIAYHQGKTDEAYRTIETALRKTKGQSVDALEYLISLLEEKRRAVTSRADKNKIDRTVFQYNLRLYTLTGNAHLLYQLGVIAERLGERDRAIRLYEQARHNLLEEDPQRAAAINKRQVLLRKERVNEEDTH